MPNVMVPSIPATGTPYHTMYSEKCDLEKSWYHVIQTFDVLYKNVKENLSTYACLHYAKIEYIAINDFSGSMLIEIHAESQWQFGVISTIEQQKVPWP